MVSYRFMAVGSMYHGNICQSEKLNLLFGTHLLSKFEFVYGLCASCQCHLIVLDYCLFVHMFIFSVLECFSVSVLVCFTSFFHFVFYLYMPYCCTLCVTIKNK